jgi:hypothetical protein
MNKEELSEWLLNKFNSCYPVKRAAYPDSIYWIYDEQFIRKLKLSKLNNKTVKLPINIKGILLFEQNKKDKVLFCDYDEIWKFFKDNYYTDSYIILKNLITDILHNNKNINSYSITQESLDYNLKFTEYTCDEDDFTIKVF